MEIFTYYVNDSAFLLQTRFGIDRANSTNSSATTDFANIDPQDIEYERQVFENYVKFEPGFNDMGGWDLIVSENSFEFTNRYYIYESELRNPVTKWY